jgi:cytochrome c2
MAEVLSTVAGRENEPAGKVFKNVKVSKDMPVKEFLTMMDAQYGRSVSASCTGCHANQNVGGVLKVDYADESPKKKQIARQMARMTLSINKELARNKELDQPFVRSTCVMCHRGAEHMPDTMEPLKNTDPPPPQRKRG